MDEPEHLDLFSGIGGFALAAKWAGFRTIAFVELDKYCQKVLARNFGAIPIHSDVFDLDGANCRGVDLITGGFPCQPFSVAGKRRGAADDRAIWPQMFRVINEARPTWVLGENVPGLIPMELDNVLSDLEGIGYSTRSFVIPACAVDARHRRDRLWIVAHANGSGSQGRNGQELRERAGERVIGEGDSQICNTTGTGLPNGSGLPMGGRRELQQEPERSTGGVCQWKPEPSICRVANGVRNRVDRLKGLGNAIVPQVAYELLREIRRLI